MSRVVLALIAVASVAVAAPPPPQSRPNPVMATSDKPPRYSLREALGIAEAYATKHAMRLDKVGYLQAGVFDLARRDWVFDWIAPGGTLTVITVHDDGTIAGP